MRDETGQKMGGDDKGEKKTFYFVIELLLEHVTINETGEGGLALFLGKRQRSIFSI